MPKFSFQLLLKALLPIGFGVFIMWYFFQQLDNAVKTAFYHALSRMHYSYVVVAVVLNVLALVVRAKRWELMLLPMGYQTTLWQRYHGLMVGYLVNLTIPRAGEASRSFVLQRLSKVPFAASFGTIVAERILDLIILFIIVSGTASYASHDFWKIKQEVISSFGKSEAVSTSVHWLKWGMLSLVFIAFMVILLNIKWRKKSIQFISALFDGFLAIFKTKRPFVFLSQTLFIWGSYLGYFFLCFLALPETSEIPINGVFIAFIAGTLGISFTNGGIGVYPVVVGLVIAHYLQSKHGNDALAIGYATGTIIWTSQTLLTLILGIISFVFLQKKPLENV
jgi:uncharacterized protein (TIRG00374 family)